MNKQFIAHFAARTVKGQTKTFSYPARDSECVCGDDGRWMMDGMSVAEDDVVDSCRKATNWAEIKSAYFPMDGFHERDDWHDNTPVNKADY